MAKTFTEGQAVEVISDSLGRRGRPTDADWKPATYLRPAEPGRTRGWHYVKMGSDQAMVPLRRLRAPRKAAP